MSDSVDTTVDTTSSRERIKRALSHGKKGRINKDLSNKIMLGVFRAAAYITTLVLVAIIAYVVINGLPHISLDFIFGWPQGVNAEGGIWPTIVSTVYVTRSPCLSARRLLCWQPSIWPSTPSRARSSSSFATLLTLWLGALHRYGPVWLRLVCRGHGPGPFDGLGRSGARALDASHRHAHHRRGHSRRPALYPLGRVRPGRHQVQVVSKIVLPSAFGRIATGIVLAIGRAIGETAVVLYTMGQAINLPIRRSIPAAP